MWVNPKYSRTSPEQPDPTPPKPSGKLILACARKGPDGAPLELRVSLDEYQGRPYISLRLWQFHRSSGAWFPTKKGASIRLSEAASVIDALESAMGLAGGSGRPSAGSPA